MAPLVDNPQIQRADLLRPLPLFQHAYIWPFTIIWPVFLRFYLSPELYDKHIGAPEWTFVWVGTIITVQALVWLCTHWSVNLNAAFTAKKARSIEDAVLIKVIPAANAGSAEICKLVRDKVRLCASCFAPPPQPLETDGILGWRQGESIVPLPEAPLSLQPRDQVLQHPDV
jgi:cation-transporting ATPase 13A1